MRNGYWLYELTGGSYVRLVIRLNCDRHGRKTGRVRPIENFGLARWKYLGQWKDVNENGMQRKTFVQAYTIRHTSK